jgi:hypothetical protein
MMRRIMMLVTVALVMAAMMVFTGSAFAQGGCQEFGLHVADSASTHKAGFGAFISGQTPVNEHAHGEQARFCP